MNASLRALALLVLAHSARAQMISATIYDTRGAVTPRSTGEMAATMPMQPSTWTGATTMAAGRTRTEMFRAAGDTGVASRRGFREALLTGGYTLSDSTGSVVVNPANKTFYVVPRFSKAALDSLARQSGMHFTTKIVKATVDSLGPGERINGHATQHYRMTIGMTMGMETQAPELDPDMASAMNSKVNLTTDFWYTDLKSFLNSPFGSDLTDGMPSLPGSTGALVQTMDSLRRKLPKGRLSMRTVSITDAGAAGMSMTFEASDEVTGIKTAQIDAKLMAVPDDYVESNDEMPGRESGVMTPAPKGSGDRWKASAWAAQLKARKP